MKSIVVAAVLLFATPARAETLYMEGRNLNSECATVDGDIGGAYAYEVTPTEAKVTHAGQSWTLKADEKGLYRGTMLWTPFGVRLTLAVVLNPAKKFMRFTSTYNCNWSTAKAKKPKADDDDD